MYMKNTGKAPCSKWTIRIRDLPRKVRTGPWICFKLYLLTVYLVWWGNDEKTSNLWNAANLPREKFQQQSSQYVCTSIHKHCYRRRSMLWISLTLSCPGSLVIVFLWLTDARLHTVRVPQRTCKHCIRTAKSWYWSLWKILFSDSVFKIERDMFMKLWSCQGYFPKCK